MKKNRQVLLSVVFLISTPIYSFAKDIAVIGTGYVGLVLGAALAEFGNKVVCLDISKDKIDMLNNGQIPIYEPGLDKLVAKNIDAGRLTFSTKVAEGIRNNEAIFIAVGTPFGDDGSADLKYVDAVAHTIGENLNGYKLVCTKSTVPIGTGKRIRNIIEQHNPAYEFDTASNPEFLREGSAVPDFLEPDRVVIGVDSQRAQEILEDVYAPLIEKNYPFLVTNIPTAEAIKYASNAFLATKISYINELAKLCDKVGADVKFVAKGMGLDKRIGGAFLYPGPGYGGSCFPKDTEALVYTAATNGVHLDIVKAAIDANNHQKHHVTRKLFELLDNDVKGKNIAVLGLAFKANTDDIRYSPAINIIKALINGGAHVKAFDPEATENMKELFPHISYMNSIDETVKGADAVAIITEWDEIASIDLAHLKKLVKTPILMDARNLFEPQILRNLGFKFDNIGRSHI